MDTSNSILNVTAWSLRSSPYPEDHEIAATCERILWEILAKLKPILRYVCTPQEFFGMKGPGCCPRCLLVGTYETPFNWEKGKPVHVFLNEQGKFFTAQKEAILLARGSDSLVVKGGFNDRYKVVSGGEPPDSGGCDPWTRLPFLELIEGLRKALAEAEEKRRQHLEAVSKRRELLDRLLGVLQTDN